MRVTVPIYLTHRHTNTLFTTIAVFSLKSADQQGYKCINKKYVRRPESFFEAALLNLSFQYPTPWPQPSFVFKSIIYYSWYLNALNCFLFLYTTQCITADHLLGTQWLLTDKPLKHCLIFTFCCQNSTFLLIVAYFKVHRWRKPIWTTPRDSPKKEDPRHEMVPIFTLKRKWVLFPA